MIRSEFLRRTVTALFIGAFTLVPVIYAAWTYLVWLCFIHFMCIFEFFRLERTDAHPQRMWLVPGSLTLWLGGTGYLVLEGKPIWMSLAILPVVLAVLLMFQLLRHREIDALHHQAKMIWAAAGYISISLWSGCFFIQTPYVFQWILIPILLIWVNDIGAYLCGSRWGRHKIAPAVSPGKSAEGTLGGALFAVAGALLLAAVWPQVPKGYVLFLGFLTPPFALAGDLMESALKRKAGVKDSGTLLPGHGGLLDRYDSFLFVLPVAVLGYFIFAP